MSPISTSPVAARRCLRMMSNGSPAVTSLPTEMRVAIALMKSAAAVRRHAGGAKRFVQARARQTLNAQRRVVDRDRLALHR